MTHTVHKGSPIKFDSSHCLTNAYMLHTYDTYIVTYLHNIHTNWPYDLPITVTCKVPQSEATFQLFWMNHAALFLVHEPLPKYEFAPRGCKGCSLIPSVSTASSNLILLFCLTWKRDVTHHTSCSSLACSQGTAKAKLGTGYIASSLHTHM